MMSRHWVIDFGCTYHVTFDRLAFYEYYKLTSPSTMGLGANSNIPIMGPGDFTLTLRLNGRQVKSIIRNVLHVPYLRLQLLSVSAMAKLHTETPFSDSGVSLHRHCDFKILASGTLKKKANTSWIPLPTPPNPLPQYRKLR